MAFDAPVAKEPIPAKKGRKPKAKAVKEKPKTASQQKAAQALQEAQDESIAFVNKIGKRLQFGFNPEHAAGAARVVAKWFKAGYYQFQAFLEALTETIGQAQVD